MKLTQNFYLKLISLLLGITLWFYVQGRETVETSVRLSLFFSDIHESLYLEDVSASDITIWIKGAKPVVSQLIKRENKVDISLKGYKVGRYSLTLTPFMLNLPKNIEIMRIQPDKISFRIQPLLEKKVRVALDYKGSRAYVVSPSIVVVKGERKVVESLDSLVTEPIEDVTGKKDVMVKLIVPSGNVKVFPERVKVTFR